MQIVLLLPPTLLSGIYLALPPLLVALLDITLTCVSLPVFPL